MTDFDKIFKDLTDPEDSNPGIQVGTLVTIDGPKGRHEPGRVIEVSDSYIKVQKDLIILQFNGQVLSNQKYRFQEDPEGDILVFQPQGEFYVNVAQPEQVLMIGLQLYNVSIFNNPHIEIEE